jgi:hypothetical protein
VAKKNKNVRFVRIRGRIVPIKSNRKKVGTTLALGGAAGATLASVGSSKLENIIRKQVKVATFFKDRSVIFSHLGPSMGETNSRTTSIKKVKGNLVSISTTRSRAERLNSRATRILSKAHRNFKLRALAQVIGIGSALASVAGLVVMNTKGRQ